MFKKIILKNFQRFASLNKKLVPLSNISNFFISKFLSKKKFNIPHFQKWWNFLNFLLNSFHILISQASVQFFWKIFHITQEGDLLSHFYRFNTQKVSWYLKCDILRVLKNCVNKKWSKNYLLKTRIVPLIKCRRKMFSSAKCLKKLEIYDNVKCLWIENKLCCIHKASFMSNGLSRKKIPFKVFRFYSLLADVSLLRFSSLIFRIVGTKSLWSLLIPKAFRPCMDIGKIVTHVRRCLEF
jgi:hypothetical protein